MTSPASSLPALDTYEPADTPTQPPLSEAQPKPEAPKRKAVRKTPKKLVEDITPTTEAIKAGTPHKLDERNGEDHEMDNTEAAPKPRYRSWRKRFRKLKRDFDGAMSEANQLFIAEDRAWDIVDRLKGENDQLKDVLYDLEEDNRSKAPHQRSWIPLDLQALHEVTTYALPRGIDKRLLPDDLVDLDGDDGHYGVPPGYLTTDHEIAYTSALDAALDAIPSTDHLPASLEPIRPTWMSKRGKAPLTENDFAERHPCSVRNWLRQNRRALFHDREKPKDKDKEKEKEKDKASEKSGRSPDGSGRKPVSKRGQKELEKMAPSIKTEANSEGADDFGEPIDGNIRGKRKRIDDDSYRPKGGGGSRSKKKKVDAKEDTGKSTVKGKGGDEDTPAEDEY